WTRDPGTDESCDRERVRYGHGIRGERGPPRRDGGSALLAWPPRSHRPRPALQRAIRRSDRLADARLPLAPGAGGRFPGAGRREDRADQHIGGLRRPLHPQAFPPSRAEAPTPPAFEGPLLAAVEDELPPRGREWIGLYLEEARLLGQRTGELHVALASDPVKPELAPEPVSDFSRQALYQAMLSLAND